MYKLLNVLNNILKHTFLFLCFGKERGGIIGGLRDRGCGGKRKGGKKGGRERNLLFLFLYIFTFGLNLFRISISRNKPKTIIKTKL